MASGGGDTHYCSLSFVIMATGMVLLNIEVGGLITTVVMIINRSSGLSSGMLAHTEWYL